MRAGDSVLSGIIDSLYCRIKMCSLQMCRFSGGSGSLFEFVIERQFGGFGIILFGSEGSSVFSRVAWLSFSLLPFPRLEFLVLLPLWSGVELLDALRPRFWSSAFITSQGERKVARGGLNECCYSYWSVTASWGSMLGRIISVIARALVRGTEI